MNAQPVRVFTPDGIEAFRQLLGRLKAREIADLPPTLVSDDRFSQIVDEYVTVEQRGFATTREMVEYLHPIILQLTLPDKFYNSGLWPWLSAFYFDAVCPKVRGWRKPGEDLRHVLPSKREWRGNHKHLIAAPLRLYDAHGPELAYPFLYTPPYQRSDILSQVMAVQELAMNSSVLEAISLLYWDARRERPKKGASDKTDESPGTLRRFVAVMNQFNMTFDLFAMTGEQIVGMLPRREFGRWMKKG